MTETDCIRKAHSCATDPRKAAQEFHALVAQPAMALVIFYCSSEYDLDALADEMKRLFGDVPVAGCTTAGEIGPAGLRDHSLAGASFPASHFRVAAGQVEQLQQFKVEAGQDFAQALLHELLAAGPPGDADHSFALLLIDGLSLREEPVTRAFQTALGRLPLLGGSAGDGMKFDRTQVYWNGRFCSDCAVLVLVASRMPFRIFKTQHIVATDDRLVVTEADAASRTVKEINGLPASQEYARMLGIDASDLDPSRFAAWPVVLTIGGTTYVRSIQKANPDGSLTFFCAIENGLVLRVAKGVDLLENLQQAFAGIRAEIGPPQLVLGYDCILRKLEIAQSSAKDRIGELLQENNTVGFHTYGEQFRGVHVNQTLVGIAFGTNGGEASHV
ncbi:FIST C-terminal domain-containing protein [Variovorax sp. VRV01]|uniref:nitric oxide-sensing protein NosP n=1 Tax=Variovorax sp. VRV01 TaxID=2769259 RepID=UPI0017860578|nr:nitric oxide-sensing protein NosP [Variovorax sp. VRV01]MBD9667372.1 FIST C-terminal domain-containing protein [Variovorax sp. VRV01]